MSISGKIKLGLSILLGVLILQFALGQFLDSSAQLKIDTVVTKNFAAAEQLAELGAASQQIRRYEKEYFIYVNDQTGRTKYRGEWTGIFEKLKTNLTAIQANKDGMFSAQDAITFQSWMNALEFYGKEFNTIMARADAGTIVPVAPIVEPVQPPAKASPASGAAPVAVAAPDLSKATKLANDMIGPGKDKFREVLDGTEKMRKAKLADSAASVSEIRKLFSMSTFASIAIFLVGLALAIYLMIAIPDAVRTSIQEFVEIADRISKGDTKQAVESSAATEFDGLAKALERLRVAQSGLLDRIRAKANVFQ
jgi:methyl-accepting chemotaxis protein